jgi:hypothetical protein
MCYHGNGADLPRHKDTDRLLHGAIFYLLKRSKEKMMGEEKKTKR